MAQLAKIIDVTKTYLPIDPQAFPETMHATGREDTPVEHVPVSAYEGYNFLPTSYGYKSFFGTNAQLNIDALTSRVDAVFIIQTRTFQNILVALCEDGIWTKQGDETGAWVQRITLTVPDEGTHYDWTYCTIEDTVYAYRQGGPEYYKFPPEIVSSNALAISTVTGLYGQAITNASAFLAAGTYTYSVASISATGQLSEPCAGIPVTLSALGEVYLQWNRDVAVASYRVYRTDSLGTVYYYDVAQPTSGTLVPFYDYGTGATAITLPDTTVYWATYDTYMPRPVVPNFLNMAGQIGLFKAGGRLGFWDSENSVAWSNLDDYADMTPSLETLAGSAIFQEVTGRIVNIKQHGQGFIIYATSSVVYVQQKVDATFMWDPVILLNKSGIAYMEEVTVGAPDTLHFAWTTTGLYKIEAGKEQLIVPEITDFLRESEDPLYLTILEGRYLCLQLLDEAYVTGQVNFSVGTVPEMTYLWEGSTTTAEVFDGVTLTGDKVCKMAGSYDEGGFLDMQADGATAHSSAGTPAKAPNTSYKPRFKCYFSYSAFDPAAITWGASPCATLDPNGVELNMCPTSNAGKLGKPLIEVPDSSAPGGQWTMERFFQIQNALWDEEERNRTSYINEILARQRSGSKTTQVGSCTPSGPTSTYCTIGEYAKDYIGRFFGFNKCTFWLTRYLKTKTTIQRKKVDKVECVTKSGGGGSPIKVGHSWTSTAGVIGCPKTGYPYAPAVSLGDVGPAEVAADMYAKYVESYSECGTPKAMVGWHSAPPSVAGTAGTIASITPILEGDACGGGFSPTGDVTYTCPTGTHCVGIGTATSCGPNSCDIICVPDDIYESVATTNASNVSEDSSVPFTPEQPYCELIGWTYTDVNGIEQSIPATGSSCLSPDTPPPTPPASNSWNGQPAPTALALDTGAFCTKPFGTINIPELSSTPIVWPDQTLTIAASSFLLQDGSPAPIYPTFQGALVYDLQLKKWGKLKLPYKRLLDYSPINAVNGDIIATEAFGINAGVLLSTGYIHLFDQYPDDSYITYGKIGYYRLGMTTMVEAKVHFRTPSTGSFEIQTSLDGRHLEAGWGAAQAFTATDICELTQAVSGRWHNLKVQGWYDIQYMEFRGVVAGRR